MTNDANVIAIEPASFDRPPLLNGVRSFPRVWTVWVALSVAMVAIIVAQTIFVLILFAYLLSQGKQIQQIQPLLETYMATPPIFILLLFFGPGLFGLVALGAGWLSPETLRARLGLVPVTTSRAIYPLSIIGSLFPMAVGLGMAEGLVWLAPKVPVDTGVAKLYEQMTPLWSIPFVILIGLLPGFCEEMLFRGYVQRRFVTRFRPLWGIVLTSVLFGLAHIMPAAVLFATVIGFYFGLIAWRCGSIWPTICCHIFINSSVNLWRMVLIFGDISERTQSVVTWSVVAISAVCFVALMRLLYRHGRENLQVMQ